LGVLPATVAVTGATGFIGTALCESLCAHGVSVRALVRDPSRATALADHGVELVTGDLANRDSLRTLVSGAEAIVHCAGTVRGRCLNDFTQTNVNGLDHLLSAIAEAAPNARLLALSSIVAREPELSWYAQSKHAGECLLQERGKSLNWIILRPPTVYGPGDREMLPIFQWMARGIATVPGSKDVRVSLIHVRDLVTAIEACMAIPVSKGQCYTPADPCTGGYNWTDMASIATEVWGRPVRLWQVPTWLLDGFARLNLSLAGVLGYAPMLTPAKLRELRHPNWVADSSDLQRDTGWYPEIDLERGLRELKGEVI
jgi:nucleoside-diphosphate-sugar epimerase